MQHGIRVIKAQSTIICAVFLLLLGLLATRGYAAGTTQLTLKEQLNQTYAHELVYYPFTADDKACRLDSVQVTGPRGPVPAQFTDVTYWPGQQTFVKSAKLAVLVDGLQPLSTDTYTVTYSDQRAAAPTSDLKVTPGKDSVEITTQPCGGCAFRWVTSSSPIRWH